MLFDSDEVAHRTLIRRCAELPCLEEDPQPGDNGQALGQSPFRRHADFRRRSSNRKKWLVQRRNLEFSTWDLLVNITLSAHVKISVASFNAADPFLFGLHRSGLERGAVVTVPARAWRSHRARLRRARCAAPDGRMIGAVGFVHLPPTTLRLCRSRTWGQTLSRHVHLHCLLQGGALERAGAMASRQESLPLYGAGAGGPLPGRFRQPPAPSARCGRARARARAAPDLGRARRADGQRLGGLLQALSHPHRDATEVEHGKRSARPTPPKACYSRPPVRGQSGIALVPKRKNGQVVLPESPPEPRQSVGSEARRAVRDRTHQAPRLRQPRPAAIQFSLRRGLPRRPNFGSGAA